MPASDSLVVSLFCLWGRSFPEHYKFFVAPAFNNTVGNLKGRNDLGNEFAVPAPANLRTGLIKL